MQRKVIQHGPATYIVSLPKTWVRKYDIQKGDDLNIFAQDNTLVISTEMRRRLKEVEVEITGLDRSCILHVIRGLYRLGYDVINVKFSNPETVYVRTGEVLPVSRVIHEEVNTLIGFEVIQEDNNKCVINDLQETSGKDFDQVLRRIFLLLLDAYDSFAQGVKEGDKSKLRNVETTHGVITKFVSYCLRLLNKKSHSDVQKTSYYYHSIAYLDRITDVLKYTARDIQKESKVTPEVAEIIKLVGENLNTYYKFFYTYSIDKISKINADRYKAEDMLRALPDNTSTRNVIVATSITSIMEMFVDLIEARTAIQY